VGNLFRIWATVFARKGVHKIGETFWRFWAILGGRWAIVFTKNRCWATFWAILEGRRVIFSLKSIWSPCSPDSEAVFMNLRQFSPKFFIRMQASKQAGTSSLIFEIHSALHTTFFRQKIS
jgi:hypothetical protein